MEKQMKPDMITFVRRPWQSEKNDQHGYITTMEADYTNTGIGLSTLIIILDVWVYHQKQLALKQDKYSPEEYLNNQKHLLEDLVKWAFERTKEPQTEVIEVYDE